ENTAFAAKLAAESDRRDIAAVSSGQCAALYGLNTLDSNIQDRDNNYTRFICISKKLRVFKNADKISITASLPHESGSLNKLLTRFTVLGVNLTKLESRPMPNTDFEFLFYFDFEADIERTEILNLITELSLSSDQFTFLGSYHEVI
ncbi:MAG: bifunctional chorismate mutase/prephenate dehydratase, partial [Clostridiales bacterium]|nr:bifunctional chorismate mutase/prephenate dehydratase [Clostridiales bacterium]